MATRTPSWPGMFRYCLAVWLPFAAFGLQWLFWTAIRPYIWFFFFPAVFFSSQIGGMAGGLTATLLSAALASFFMSEGQDAKAKGGALRYKDLKKRMKQTFKHIGLALGTGQVPDAGVLAAFIADSRRMSWPRGNRS